MTTSTTQTATGAVTMVTMVLANGGNVPTQIHLDAESVKPAADGSILVNSKYAPALMQAGWAFKYPGGASVPVV
ncbi:hypothetical protein [uncultured Rhodoblastus sp.]|uniref:hypothetical protein n=1 Tax=uncultured Rhodoblastus sp. TaxID=543037 RepID=UPI0025CCBD3A|nr:hypothetical protein [uncultured Rhodoblastus sp.]